MFQFLKQIQASAAADDKDGDDVSADKTKQRKFKTYRIHRSFTKSKAPRGRLVAVAVGLLNPEHILRMSVCEVTEPRLFNKQQPLPNSLNDLRMGPVDREFKCATCSDEIDTCEGHPGHIVLPRRVYHPCYMMTILRVLECVCHSCSRFLLPESDPRFAKIMAIDDPVKRLSKFAKVCKTIDFCGGAAPPELLEQLQHQHHLGAQQNKDKSKAQWMCAWCPTTNSPSATACTECHQPRPTMMDEGDEENARGVLDVKTYLDVAARRLGDTSDWSCPWCRCTQNPHTAHQCTKCSKDRPRGCHTAQRVYLRSNKLVISGYDRMKKTSKRVAKTTKTPAKKQKAASTKVKAKPKPKTKAAGSKTAKSRSKRKSAAKKTEPKEKKQGTTTKKNQSVDMDLGSAMDGKSSETGTGTAAATTATTATKAKTSASLVHRCGTEIKPFTPDEVCQIFRNIAEADLEKLGFRAGMTRPEFALISVLVVPPPSTRLPTLSSTGSHTRGENDATRHLKRILNFTNKLREKQAQLHRESHPELTAAAGGRIDVSLVGSVFDESSSAAGGGTDRKKLHAEMRKLFDCLQKAVGQYIDSDASGGSSMPGYTKTPLKDMVKRFTKKDGRVRGTLNTKRVDFCARSVIGPETHLDIDQLGVPWFVCGRVPYPEPVNQYNIHKLQCAVIRGPDARDGALKIRHLDGSETDLRTARNYRKRLQYGETVIRHLRRDDLVLFNRQPSLHKMSVMGFRVVPHEGYTFRLNLACTKPFNADFDGDEMNLFVPQTEEARAELLAFMMVPLQITDPQDKACMGVVQDAQVSAYLCTDKDIFVTREQMMQCAAQLHYWDGWMGENGGLPPPAVQCRKPTGATDPVSGKPLYRWIQLWTGKQCASLALPKVPSDRHGERGIEYLLRLNDQPLRNKIARLSKDEADNKQQQQEVVKVENELRAEMSQLWDDQVVCISQSELLVGRFDKSILGPSRGGLVQSMVHDMGHEITRQFLSDVQRFFNYWIAEYGHGIGISDCLMTDRQRVQVDEIVRRGRAYLRDWQHPNAFIDEQHRRRVMGMIRDQAGLVALDPRKNINKTIASGAKGTVLNSIQTGVMLGQVVVGGERIPKSYNGERSLPHFRRDSRDPEARAFIDRSFIDGLRPVQQYFHAQGGREGLVDTANKTADVGYIIRRLMRCLEDVRVQYDQTVRDTENIISLTYGGDGFDTTRLETQHYFCLGWSPEQLAEAHDVQRHLPLLSNESERAALSAEFAQILDDVRALRRIKLQIQRRELETELKVPVNFARLLRTAQAGMLVNKHDLSPLDVIQQVRDLTRFVESQMRAPDGLFAFLCLMRLNLCSVNVVVRHRLDRQAFDYVVEEVRMRFIKSLVQPGESVGAIAGQSIGEPSQQMTLNTFHSAGLGMRNMTAGIRALDDLIRVSHKARNPTCEVYLQPHLATSKAAALELMHRLKLIMLSKVVSRDIIFAPDVTFAPPPEQGADALSPDRALINRHMQMLANDPDRELSEMSACVIRFVVNRERCLGFKKTIDDVFWMMRAALPGNHLWIRSPVNAARWVILLRLKLTSVEFRKQQKNAQMQRRGRRPKKMTNPAKQQQQDAADAVLVAASAGSSVNGQQNELAVVRQLADGLLKLPFHGIRGILGATLVEQPRIDIDSADNVVRSTEFVIETRGSNLRRILTLPGVDATRTVSSNIVEVEQVLGIDAAATVLLTSILKVFKQNDAYVNFHHVYTATTQMSQTGELLGLTRSGFQKSRKMASFFKRLSFEKIVRVLMEGGQLGEVEPLTGITANIIVGNAPPIGTNTCTVYCLPEIQTTPELCSVLQHNQRTLAERLMDPLELVDLVSFLPSLMKNRQFKAQLERHPKSKSGAAYVNYRQMIAAKNCRRIVPDYSFLRGGMLPGAKPKDSTATTRTPTTDGKTSTSATATAESTKTSTPTAYTYTFPFATTCRLLRFKSSLLTAPVKRPYIERLLDHSWKSELESARNLALTLPSTAVPLPLPTTYKFKQWSLPATMAPNKRRKVARRG